MLFIFHLFIATLFVTASMIVAEEQVYLAGSNTEHKRIVIIGMLVNCVSGAAAC